MKKEKKKNSSRRDFLDYAMLTGSGLLAGTVVSGNVIPAENSDKVRMITLDGQLVEVDTKFIQKTCSERISNASLKALMEKEKNKGNNI